MCLGIVIRIGLVEAQEVRIIRKRGSVVVELCVYIQLLIAHDVIYIVLLKEKL